MMATGGQVLAGRYQLAEQLGAGSSGSVHAATDLATRRAVAVRLPSVGVPPDPDLVRRFFVAARAASRAHSPYVVELLDFGLDEVTRRCFVVYERLDAPTLGQRLADRGPLATRAACLIAEQLVRALLAADDAGIFHERIHPGNVFVIDDGATQPSARLADLGLARVVAVEDADTVTNAASAYHAAAYSTPEHVLGRPADIRSDLYVVGSLLFEMLTGERAFDATSPAELTGLHVNSPTPSLPATLPDGAAPSLPLRALLTRLLAKTPERRPDNLRATADILHGLADGAPIIIESLLGDAGA